MLRLLFHFVPQYFTYNFWSPLSDMVINKSDVLAELITECLTSSDDSMYIHQPCIESSIYMVSMHHLLMKRVTTLPGQLSAKFYFGNMSMYQQLILHQTDLL